MGPAVFTNTSGGSWSTAANWQNSVIAGGTDTTANFGTLNITANRTVTLDGSRAVGNLIFGDTTPSNNWTLAAGTGGTLTLATSGGTPTITVNNQTATASAALATTEGIVKIGSGTFVQGTNDNFQGGLTINAGTYEVTAGGWYTNPFTNSNLITVNAGGTLQTGGAHSLGTDQNSVWIDGGTLLLGAEQYVSSLHMTGGTVSKTPGASYGDLRTFGGTMTFDSPNGTAVIDSSVTYNLVGNATLNVSRGSAAKDLTIGAVIINSNSLTKGGAGIAEVTGANTYSGGTTVSAGTFWVDNTSGSGTGTGAVAVNSGGTLGGTGIISGAVTVAAGATLGPGAGGIGTLTINNTLTLNGLATMDINKAAGTSDKVLGVTTLTYGGGTLTVTNLGGTLAAGDTFTLFAASSYSGSFGAINLPTLGANLVWDTSHLATNGTIAVAVNGAPSVATPAAAPLNSNATAASLSVLGSDAGGEPNLTYTWTYTGPSVVAFSANGTNAAKNSTATFAAAGSYVFTATITNQNQISTTSSVNVTVAQNLTSMTLTPLTANLASLGTQQFTATGLDQFSAALATQPTFSWTATSGSVSAAGLFTAPAATSSTTVTATSGSLSKSATVQVTNAAPTVATAAAASPTTVTAKTTGLLRAQRRRRREQSYLYMECDERAAGRDGSTYLAPTFSAQRHRRCQEHYGHIRTGPAAIASS